MAAAGKKGTHAQSRQEQTEDHKPAEPGLLGRGPQGRTPPRDAGSRAWSSYLGNVMALRPTA